MNVHVDVQRPPVGPICEFSHSSAPRVNANRQQLSSNRREVWLWASEQSVFDSPHCDMSAAGAPESTAGDNGTVRLWCGGRGGVMCSAESQPYLGLHPLFFSDSCRGSPLTSAHKDKYVQFLPLVCFCFCLKCFFFKHKKKNQNVRFGSPPWPFHPPRQLQSSSHQVETNKAGIS